MSVEKKSVDPSLSAMSVKVLPRLPECEEIHAHEMLRGTE